MTSKIGIISDAHGLLRPEVERRLAGVDYTVHGGDIGRRDIIAALRRIAPVTAIRGNVDSLVGVDRLQSFEPGFLDHVDRGHPSPRCGFSKKAAAWH